MSTNEKPDQPIEEKKPARKRAAPKTKSTATPAAKKPRKKAAATVAAPGESAPPAPAKKRRPPAKTKRTKPAVETKVETVADPVVESAQSDAVHPESEQADAAQPGSDKWTRVQSQGESVIQAVVNLSEGWLKFLDEAHYRIAAAGRARGFDKVVDAYDAAHASLMPTLQDVVATTADLSRTALFKATEFARQKEQKKRK